MTEKYFNRKLLSIIIYTVSICLFLINILGLIFTITNKYWTLIGLVLLGVSAGLCGLAIAINKTNDIIINYQNKELEVNLRFNNKEKLCIPFDSIVNVYETTGEKLEKELKFKKIPKRILVIERKSYKEYIPLNLFDEDSIKSLKRELLKVRDSYENFI